MMKQHTLRNTYTFSGKGLHSGKKVTMTVGPAADNTGIVFHRVDLGEEAIVPALAKYVHKTDRSTSLKKGKAEVRTTEHLLAALVGLGVDNASVCLDNKEVPILDGSSQPYADAILADGLQEQESEREYFVVEKEVEYTDPESGSSIKVLPFDGTEYEVKIDFNSKVIGIQCAIWNSSVIFARDLAPARTFCFLKEVKPLLALGLIKGGDLSNALVIDEPKGYYGEAVPRFDNECARHKLLDLMGDLALIGKPLKGRVVAYKPGHKINSKFAALLAAV